MNWCVFYFMWWQINIIDFWQIEWFQCRQVSIDHRHDPRMWWALHRWCTPIVLLEPAFPSGRHNLSTHISISTVPNDLSYINGMIQSSLSNLVAARVEIGNWHHVKLTSSWSPSHKHHHFQGIAFQIQYQSRCLVGVWWTLEWILARRWNNHKREPKLNQICRYLWINC